MSIDTSSTPARRWVGSLGEGVVDVEDEAVDLEVQAAIELAARLLLAVQAGS
jgi:hypothetical protein